MTLAEQKGGRLPEPDDKVRLEGAMLVLVPLIIGAAVVIGVVMLWGADRQRSRRAAAAVQEEEIQADLLRVYALLRRNESDRAISLLDRIGDKLDRLSALWSNPFLELRTSWLMMEAEALLTRDAKANAEAAETLLGQALDMMNLASGEQWVSAMYLLARTKYEKGDYAGAVADFDALLDRNPSFGSAYYWRSAARREIGDADGAAADEIRARNLESWPPLRDSMAGGLAEWDADDS